MTPNELRSQIKRTATVMRNAGWSAKIDDGLPTISVENEFDENNFYFFQEHEASDLYDQIHQLDEIMADLDGNLPSETDMLLYLANGW